MNREAFRIVLSAVLLLIGCGVPPAYQPPGEWSRIEQGQLPERRLREATIRFEGSFESESGNPPAQQVPPPSRVEEASPLVSSAPPPAESPVEPAPAPASGRGVVLGLIVFEGEDATVRDAGVRIREVLSQRLAALKKIQLHDAPEERYKDDSPRPDLARKGVRYVVKGVASRQGSQMTAFLRVVDTAGGQVAMVVSGRGNDADAAAQQAAERLVQKLVEAMP